MNKKTIICLFFFLLPSIYGWAQNLDIVQRIADLNKENATLTADFVETKVMPRMKKQIVRKGSLYFKSEGEKLLMDYSEPSEDYTLIKDGIMYVKKGDKQQKFLGQNSDGRMAVLKNSLINALNGNISAIANDNKASVKAEAKAKTYECTLTRDDDKKSGIHELLLIYDKATGALVQLKIVEGNGNYTTYETTNTRVKQAIADDIFNIK